MKKLLLFIAAMLAFGAADLDAAITRVQSKTANTGASSVATLNIVMDSTPTAGNIIVLAASYVGVASSTPGQSGALSGTGISWIYVLPPTQGGNTTFGMLAVGRVHAGASATITFTCSSAAGGIALAAAEYSGVGIVAVDKYVSATGTSTSPASGATSTTSSNNQLWVGSLAARTAVTFSSPTNSFTIVGQDKTTISSAADRSVALTERIVSSTGTADSGATITSAVWVAQVLTLEEAAAAGVAEHSFIFPQ